MENKIEKMNILGNEYYMIQNNDMMVVSKSKEQLEMNSFQIHSLLHPDEYKPVGLYGNTTIENQLEKCNMKFTDYFNSSDYMRYVSVPDKNYFVLSRVWPHDYHDQRLYIRPVFYKHNDLECELHGMIFFTSDSLTIENTMIPAEKIISNLNLRDIVKDHIGMKYKHWMKYMHNRSDYVDEVVFVIELQNYLKPRFLSTYVVKASDVVESSF